MAFPEAQAERKTLVTLDNRRTPQPTVVAIAAGCAVRSTSFVLTPNPGTSLTFLPPGTTVRLVRVDQELNKGMIEFPNKGRICRGLVQLSDLTYDLMIYTDIPNDIASPPTVKQVLESALIFNADGLIAHDDTHREHLRRSPAPTSADGNSKRRKCSVLQYGRPPFLVGSYRFFDLMLRANSFVAATAFIELLHLYSTCHKARHALWSNVRNGIGDHSYARSCCVQWNTCDLCGSHQGYTWKRHASTDANRPPRTWQACRDSGRCILAALRGMWASNATLANAYPIFRQLRTTAIPRANGMFSIGIVTGYRWSVNMNSWAALVRFTSCEYATPEDAQRAGSFASQCNDVSASLTKLVPLTSLSADNDDLFLTV